MFVSRMTLNARIAMRIADPKHLLLLILSIFFPSFSGRLNAGSCGLPFHRKLTIGLSQIIFFRENEENNQVSSVTAHAVKQVNLSFPHSALKSDRDNRESSQE